MAFLQRSYLYSIFMLGIMFDQIVELFNEHCHEHETFQKFFC